MSPHDETSGNDAPLTQLRFATKDAQTALTAKEVSNVLAGLHEINEVLNSKNGYGAGTKATLEVKPFREGSLIIEVVTELMGSPAAQGVLDVAGATTVAWFIKRLLDKTRASEISDFDILRDGTVKVKWHDGTVEHVSRPVWHEFSKLSRKSKGAMRKIMTPLDNENRIMELRQGSANQTTAELEKTPAERVANRSDWQRFQVGEDEPADEPEWFEAVGKFSNVNFNSGEGWRFETEDSERRVSIEDEDFLAQVQEDGRSFNKSGTYTVKIREEKYWTDQQRRTTWAIEEVNPHDSNNLPAPRDTEAK